MHIRSAPAAIALLALLVVGCAALPWSNPPQIVSSNGLLEVEFDAARAQIVLAGQTVNRELYNATLNPPVLRLKQGDTLRLTLVNLLTFTNSNTNIHWHGLSIPPISKADNIFDEVSPNNTYVYDFKIPTDHPVGTFWYHSHAMDKSEAQVYQGMSGIIIVDPPTGAVIDKFPQLAGKQERVFPLRELVLPSPRVQIINLLQNPTITMQPGDVEYWRIGNVGANNHYTVSFPAGLTAVRVASDGHYLNAPQTVTSVTLATGGRADIIVRADAAGAVQVTSAEVDMYGASTGNGSPAALVLVNVTGTPITPVALPTGAINDLPDLGKLSVTRKRKFQLSSNEDETEYYINGVRYDPTRTDVTVEINDVEEWTVQNLDTQTSTKQQQLHTFHLHQLPFQVMKIDGRSQPFSGYVDTVDVAPGSTVVIRIFFNDPNVLGKFVFHCHILKHEDLGMMGVIQVIPDNPNNNASAALASVVALVAAFVAALLLM